MKLFLLVGFLVAGALGGLVPKAVVGYSAVNAGVDQARATDDVRDWVTDAKEAQRWSTLAEKKGRDNADFGDVSARGAAKDKRTGSNYGAKASNWDKSDNAASRAADQAAQTAFTANQWADAADANKALKDQQWAQGNQFYQGRRKNDDINYAYDKSFDLRDSNNGGFELAESSNSHALDDFRDRAANFDHKVDQDTAWASAADAAKANRKSAAGHNAAAGASNWDKFFSDSAKTASANGRDKDWANKIDQSQGANRLWSDARRTASDVYKGLATADGSYQRNAKELAGKNGVYGPAVYGYGLAGVGGYAAKPGYYQPLAKGGAAADAAQAWNQAAKSALRQSDDAATVDNTKAAFSRDQWLDDRNRGFDRDSKAAGSDKGGSDWARQAAQSANRAEAASADSANAWNNDAASATFDENLWKKEAERKRLSDRDQNKKALQKYFNNKRRGGDNWERLKFDRDASDDVFGFDSAAKKDWAQSANANQLHTSADANRNTAQAARAADAARNGHQADWRKDAAGFQNANAASRASDAARRNGFKNQKWNDHQAANAYDARAENAQKWDLGASRDNAAAVGSLAPKVGVVYGAGNVAAYPPGGYYGYPVVGVGYGKGYGYPAVGYGAGYGFPKYGYY